MSLNQPLLLSSALVHQMLLNPTTYPSKQVNLSALTAFSSAHPNHSSDWLPKGTVSNLQQCLVVRRIAACALLVLRRPGSSLHDP